MIATVHRPWSVRRPLASLLAWRIRAYSSRISGHPAAESHAMIYIGRGRCASQGGVFDIVPLSAYRGCVLSFWDWPVWSDGERNDLTAEAAVHRGDEYAYRDILALAVWAVTGSRRLMERLQDRTRWFCSEAVCSLVRKIMLRYGGWGNCMRTPQQLADWMASEKFSLIKLRIK